MPAALRADGEAASGPVAACTTCTTAIGKEVGYTRVWTAEFEGQGIRVIRVNCWNYFLHRRLEGRSDCWHVVRLLWSLIATQLGPRLL